MFLSYRNGQMLRTLPGHMVRDMSYRETSQNSSSEATRIESSRYNTSIHLASFSYKLQKQNGSSYVCLIWNHISLYSAFQAWRCCNGHMDWAIQQEWERGTVHKWREVLQFWLWIQLHSGPLPKPKIGSMSLGKVAETFWTQLLWLMRLFYGNNLNLLGLC